MLSIIILEDDAVSASVVARIFASKGHKARISAKISDAWAQLRAEPADLLVLDTDLGGEWGWEMLERVRRSVVFRELPTIVYSATWRRDIVRRYMLLGVQGMLVKPYTPARLLEEATRAAESGWREPFFDFPKLPDESGADAAKREAILAIERDCASILETGERLAGNCVDIALQARMAAVGVRARAAGFALLCDIAERFAAAAIEMKVDRLPAFQEDLELSMGILRRMLNGDYVRPATVPAIAVASAHGAQAARSG